MTPYILYTTRRNPDMPRITVYGSAIYTIRRYDILIIGESDDVRRNRKAA